MSEDLWAKIPILDPLNRYPSLLEPEKVPTADLKMVINSYSNYTNCS